MLHRNGKLQYIRARPHLGAPRANLTLDSRPIKDPPRRKWWRPWASHRPSHRRRGRHDPASYRGLDDANDVAAMEAMVFLDGEQEEERDEVDCCTDCKEYCRNCCNPDAWIDACCGGPWWGIFNPGEPPPGMQLLQACWDFGQGVWNGSIDPCSCFNDCDCLDPVFSCCSELCSMAAECCGCVAECCGCVAECCGCVAECCGGCCSSGCDVSFWGLLAVALVNAWFEFSVSHVDHNGDY